MFTRLLSRLLTGWFPSWFTLSRLVSLPRLFTGLVARLRRRWSWFLSSCPRPRRRAGWKRFRYGCRTLRNLLLWELFSNTLATSAIERPAANNPIPFPRVPFPLCDVFRAPWVVHCLGLRHSRHLHHRLDEIVLHGVSHPYESSSWKHDQARRVFRSYGREAK